MTPVHVGLGLTVLTFAVVIGVLIFVHEMGHYLAARLLGIPADTFSIGFGRELAGFTDARGTRWKLSILPLGGYVRFAGDADASSRPGDLSSVPPAERARLFHGRPLWQRALVIAAGPLTNVAFAWLLFAGLFLVEGRWIAPPVIGRVVAGSPAERAGLRAGDRVVALDGTPVDDFSDIVAAAARHPRTLQVGVARDGGRYTVTVVPGPVADGRAGSRVGIGVFSTRPQHAPCPPGPAAVAAARQVGRLIAAIAGGLGDVVTGRVPASELGGPVKIAQVSGQAAALGLPNLVAFVAFVSINLGFINLLPVPVLDGGHLFLYAVEAVRRRPLAPKAVEWAFMSGFAALMSLMVFLTWNDLAGIGLWHRLSGLFG